MKKLLLLVCFLLAVVAVDAKTIYWLTFIDTNDKNVGEIDVLGREVLYNHFIDEVNAALAENGYEADVQDFYGNKVTPENCKSAIELLRVTSEDIVVFYYIGHGGRPSTDAEYMKKHPWPQMCMSQRDENKYIPLEWVHKTLGSKGARLAVTIGMCCNSLSNISIKEGPKFSPNYGATYVGSNKMKRIQDLFLNATGSVLATSASPKQTSGCLRSDFGVVDAYTTVLCTIFDKALDSYEQTLTWNDLLNNISYIVNEKTDGEQTPIHDVSGLTASAKPIRTKPVTPTQSQIQNTKQQQTPSTTKQSGNGDDWINDLTSIFDALVNTSIDEEKRMQLADDIKVLFSSNAKVNALGQDETTSVDTESSADFLDRISTSHIILKVIVKEGSFDNNNRITKLKVKEVYKK